MATHSNNHTRKIPWAESLVGYSSQSCRVRHDWYLVSPKTAPSQSPACSQGNPFLAGNATDWLWPILNFYINGSVPCILGLASLTQQYEMHPLAVCSNSLVCEYNIIDQFYYWWIDIWVVSWVWLSGIVLLWNTWWFYFTFLLAVFLRLELLELKVYLFHDLWWDYFPISPL